MKYKHYACFEKELSKNMVGDSLNMKNWKALRISEINSPYTFEKTVENYEKNCIKSISYINIAKIICEILKNEKPLSKNVISLGVGKGILEWAIKNICPDIKVTCTDYESETIESLKKLFINLDNAFIFDMINDNYTVFDDDSIVLMHRISTEFNKYEWMKIFNSLYNANIQYVIFIPAELANVFTYIKEQIMRLYGKLQSKKEYFCGWCYSEKEFIDIFKGTQPYFLYNIKNKYVVKGSAIYFLTINK